LIGIAIGKVQRERGNLGRELVIADTSARSS